jgi:hypothetical protein
MFTDASAAKQYESAKRKELERLSFLGARDPGFFTPTTPQERAAIKARGDIINKFRLGEYDPKPTAKPKTGAPEVPPPAADMVQPPPPAPPPPAGDRTLPTARPAGPSMGGLGALYTAPEDLYANRVIPEEKSAEAERQRFLAMVGDDPNRAKQEERLAAMQTRAEKEEAQAPWMALAEAGLGMAAGNSPFALQNIATGGMQGIKSLQAAKERAAKAEEKRFDLQTALDDKKRDEELVATKFGFDSEQYSQARKDTLESEKIAAQQKLKSDIATNKFEEKKFNIDAALKEKEINVSVTNALRSAKAIENRADRDVTIARIKALGEESKLLKDMLKELGDNNDLTSEQKLQEYNRINSRIDGVQNLLRSISAPSEAGPTEKQKALINKHLPAKQ